jgi:thioredoxin reductase
VIVSSGTRPCQAPDIEISPEARNRVVSEVGELWGVSDACIAVVGGGDAAFDYALGLSGENDVTILVRGSSPRCLPLLESRARSHERVTIREKTRLTAVAGAPGGRLRLRSSPADADGASEHLDADYLVLAVGREPADGFLSDDVRRNAPALEARRELTFAGDVRGGIFRQASIASGQGTHAAMKVAAMLRERVGEGAGLRMTGEGRGQGESS